MFNFNDIIRFWFEELEPEQWWQKDDALDLHIAKRFMTTHEAARACELSDWRDDPLGRLAEIIVLDQFSRNIHRGLALAFANDQLALGLAQEALRQGLDQHVDYDQRAFFYMPFMHSESRVIHEQALEIFEAYGSAEQLDYEIQHKVIIDRFGRYPHRNEILGRKSTPDELEFLKQPGSSF